MTSVSDERLKILIEYAEECSKPWLAVDVVAALRELASYRRDGWVLVPVYPSPSMTIAGRAAVYQYDTRLGDTDGVDPRMTCADEVYRAMLSAAPAMDGSKT